MGAHASTLEKEIGAEHFPPNENYFGLINYGNTCYCNAVLQALYFCRPFREHVLNYRPLHVKKHRSATATAHAAATAVALSSGLKSNHQHSASNGSSAPSPLAGTGPGGIHVPLTGLGTGNTNFSGENLLTCLNDLYSNIASQKKRTGSLHPKKFVARLRKDNESFDNYLQQDAHEFLNFLLNTIADILKGQKLREEQLLDTSNNSQNHAVNEKNSHSKQTNQHNSSNNSNSNKPNQHQPNSASCKDAPAPGSCPGEQPSYPFQESKPPPPEPTTWIHDIFQGVLTSETVCLTCETVRRKDENFIDLSLDIVENNCSITHCLRKFSHTETLNCDHKFFCDTCCSKQEARKRMRLKKLPQVLAIHLKRFKFQESLGRYTKLAYRVVYPLQLRLFNTSEECPNPDVLYELVGVVIHAGSTPNRGHYIAMVRSNSVIGGGPELWLLFDDDNIEKIDPAIMEEFFGQSSETNVPGSTATKPSETAYILFYQAVNTGNNAITSNGSVVS